jgi:hypothetical protein
MGVIADFIVATETEALEYSRTQTGISASDLLEAKGITRVELSTLFALVSDMEWHEDMLDMFPPVGDEESSLMRVSDELLTGLLGLITTLSKWPRIGLRQKRFNGRLTRRVRCLMG